MGNSIQRQQQLRQKVWIAVRFVVFGLGGFLLVIESCAYLHPYFSPTLALVGALSMLFGSGAWGRWAYLYVFLTIPVTVTVLVVVLLFFPLVGSRWPWNLVDPAIDMILIFMLPLLGSYVLVRRYYQKQEIRKIAPTSIAISPPEEIH